MSKEKIFAEGFSFKRRESAPEFVIGSLSIKEDEAIAFIKANSKRGWVNLEVKQARTGNYYLELDTYEPKANTATETAKASEPEDELPF